MTTGRPNPVPAGWREGTPADESFVQSVARANRRHLNVLPEPSRSVMHELQQRAQTNAYREQYPDHRPYILTDPHGAGVGYALLNWGPEVTLVDFAVHPDWQGRGHGSGALDALQRCTDRPVILTVARGNRAEHLYRRAGFQPCGGDEMNLWMRWSPAADLG